MCTRHPESALMSLRSGNHRAVASLRLALCPFISLFGGEGSMTIACAPGRCDLRSLPPMWLRRLHFLDEVTSRDGLPLEFWGF